MPSSGTTRDTSEISTAFAPYEAGKAREALAKVLSFMKTSHRAPQGCVRKHVCLETQRTRVPTSAVQEQQCKWAPGGALVASLLEETQLQSIIQEEKANMGETEVVSDAFKKLVLLNSELLFSAYSPI